jgi:hypothetical protein
MTADPKLGRAAALRNAMLTYMNDRGAAERLPGILGTVLHHRRGGGEMTGHAGVAKE